MKKNINISTINKQKIQYSDVNLNTPFVKRIIKDIAETSNKKIEDIELELKIENDYFLENIKDKPDSIYSVLRKNSIEKNLFQKINADNIKFDETIFYKLFNIIISKNKSFLKIRNPITGKKITLNIILTPQPDFVYQPKWVKKVKTASASPEGDVIFNINFCKKLIKYAKLKGVNPKGYMYNNHGGEIPKEYSYIEFIILHEIYHIIHADHFFCSKKEEITPKIQNFLGDYITNYNLVKNGYEQLPVGLFSNVYNYDHFNSMEDMQEAILKDFEKLNQYDFKYLMNNMDEHLDNEHQQMNDDKNENNICDNIEDILDKSFNNTDYEDTKADDSQNTKNDIDKKEKDVMNGKQNINNSISFSSSNNKINKNRKLRTPIKWKQLLKKMVPKTIEIEVNTIKRMHKKTISQIAIGDDRVSIKPGVIKNKITLNHSLLFILDCSGSMLNTIELVIPELKKLIKEAKQNKIKDIWIIKFDTLYKVYKLNLDTSKTTFQELEEPKKILTSNNIESIVFKNNKKNIEDLLDIQWGGGTIFPEDIFKIIEKFLKESFNQILFTDSDILSSHNFSNLKKACEVGKKRKYSFNLILEDKNTYENIRNKLGGTYQYMSYINK